MPHECNDKKIFSWVNLQYNFEKKIFFSIFPPKIWTWFGGTATKAYFQILHWALPKIWWTPVENFHSGASFNTFLLPNYFLGSLNLILPQGCVFLLIFELGHCIFIYHLFANYHYAPRFLKSISGSFISRGGGNRTNTPLHIFRYHFLWWPLTCLKLCSSAVLVCWHLLTTQLPWCKSGTSQFALVKIKNKQEKSKIKVIIWTSKCIHSLVIQCSYNWRAKVEEKAESFQKLQQGFGWSRLTLLTSFLLTWMSSKNNCWHTKICLFFDTLSTPCLKLP